MQQLRMRHLVAASAVILSVSSVPALAQTVAASAGLGGPVSTSNDHLSDRQTARNPNQAPAFHVFGVPVVIEAPVAPPYSAADEYSTFAGQPGGGENAILAASVGGAP